jgi:hypothetical protein
MNLRALHTYVQRTITGAPLLAGAALACTVLVAGCGISVQRVAFLKPDPVDSLRARKLDLAGYEKKYGKYDGVFLNFEQTVDFFGSGTDWRFAKVQKLRYLVLNPDAEWLGTFKVEEEKGEKLQQADIKVMSPEGTVQHYSMADLKVEGEEEGERSYKFAYPDIRKGTIIEEDYEMELPPETDDVSDFSLQYSVPCEHISFSYIYPQWWDIRVKKIAPDRNLDYKTLFDDAIDKRVLYYTASDVPPLVDEPYSPIPREIASYLQIINSGVTYGGYHHRYTWKELASGFTRFAINRNSSWSDRLASTVSEITSDSMTKFQKLDAIVTYLQQNITPSRGDEDDNFADVLKKKSGNFYQINGLAREMLEEAGIESEIVLIHSARDGYFDIDFVSPGQLYTPAVTATLDDTLYVVFPYSRNLPVGLIPDHFQGQKGMKVSEMGYDGFITIPEGNAANNTVNDDYHLTINDEGEIAITEEKTLRGMNAYWLREHLADLDEDEVKSAMKDLLTYSEGDVRISSYEILHQKEYREPLVIRLHYTIDNLVTVTPDEVIFQTGGLFSPSSIRKWKVDTEERNNPIRIYNDEQLVKSIVIDFPKNWSLTTPIPPVSQENLFGSVTGTHTLTDGQLRVEQRRILKRSSEPKEKADELLEVTGAKSRLRIPTLVFKVNNK